MSITWLSRKDGMFTALVICRPSCDVNGGSRDRKTHSCDDDSLIGNMSSRRTNVWLSWEMSWVVLSLPTYWMSHVFCGLFFNIEINTVNLLLPESWASLPTGDPLLYMIPVAMCKSIMATEAMLDSSALFPDRLCKPPRHPPWPLVAEGLTWRTYL